MFKEDKLSIEESAELRNLIHLNVYGEGLVINGETNESKVRVRMGGKWKDCVSKCSLRNYDELLKQGIIKSIENKKYTLTKEFIKNMGEKYKFSKAQKEVIEKYSRFLSKSTDYNDIKIMKNKHGKEWSYKVVKKNKVNNKIIYTPFGGISNYSEGALNTRSVNTLISRRVLVLVEETEMFSFYKYLNEDGVIL